MSWQVKAVSNRLFLLVLASLLCLPLQGQDPALLKAVVKVNRGSCELQDLMDAVSRQQGVSVAYDSRKISPYTRVQLPKNAMTVKEIFRLLKKTSGIRYKQRGKHIILLPRVKKSILRKKKIRTLVKAPVPAVDTTSTVPADTLRFVPPPLPSADSVAVSPLADSLISSSLSETPAAVPPVAGKRGVPVVRYTPQRLSGGRTYSSVRRYVKAHSPGYFSDRVKQGFFVNAGLLANEVFYLGLNGQVGIRNLQVDATLFQSQGRVHWRGGIKARYDLSARHTVMMGFQTGPVMRHEESYTEIRTEVITITPDSAKPYDSTLYFPEQHGISIRGTWSTVDFGLSYRVSSQFSVYGAVTYNMLRQQFVAVNGTMGDPAAQIPADKLPGVVAAPYSFQRDPEDQQWIGVQLTLSYHF